MSELSARSGLAIATIKYYLREGLVPPGIRSAANQANYDEDHVHRLRLIRALVEVGELPIATVRAVLGAVDDSEMSLHQVLGVAHHSLAMRSAQSGPSPAVEAVADVDRFLEDRGWEVAPDAPARRDLAKALATLQGLGWAVDAQVFARYATAADRLAAFELRQIPRRTGRAQTVEAAVVGTVVFEAALLALRRMAEEHYSATRFSAGP
ncbi:MAG TPA: MerR family transcriptional regulator [Acidimicrobiales bacterium]|jgi:DNA-binding transcriptional MerR regulator